MLLLAFMNRAPDDERPRVQRLFLYVGGMAVCESLLLKVEYIARPDMHSAPLLHRRDTRHRWDAHRGGGGVAPALGVYNHGGGVHGVRCGLSLDISTLSSSSRNSGQSIEQITHFIPWEFPLLIIVFTLAIDLVLQQDPPAGGRSLER